MKRFLLLLIAALGGAGILSAVASTTPFEQRLLRVEVGQALPALADALATETDALNTVFLAYADDETLWLSARLALLRHGDLTRTVLTEYGLDPDFQRVLARFGADAILPVAYFHDHEIATLTAQHWANTQYERASWALSRWWAEEQATVSPDAAAGSTELSAAPPSLTAHRRGDYAIAFLDAEGHDFLGQFVVDRQEQVQWVQSERVVSDIGNFLTGGLRGLESKWRQGDTINTADAAWAGVDLLVMASALKALKAGRALQAGRVEAQGARAATQTAKDARLLPTGWRLGRLSRGAQIAAVATTAYVVVRHPSLINALGATLANWLGLPVKVVQFALWALILLPLLAVIRGLYRWLLVPLLWLLYHGLRLTARRPRRGKDAAARA